MSNYVNLSKLFLLLLSYTDRPPFLKRASILGSLPINFLNNSIGCLVLPLDNTLFLNESAVSLLKIPSFLNFSNASASNNSAHFCG